MPSKQKSTHLAFFDLDGTLTTTRSPWKLLLESFQKWKPDGKKNLADFLAGKHPGNAATQYEEFCRLDAELLKGMPVQEFDRILGSIIFRENIAKLTAWLKSKHTKLILISAGFTQLAERAVKLFNFDAYHANQLLFSDGILDGRFKVNVGWHGKKPLVQQYKSYYKNIDQTLAFGDTSGDIPMFEEADHSFACFEATEEAINAAKYHISDFKEAISILKQVL